MSHFKKFMMDIQKIEILEHPSGGGGGLDVQLVLNHPMIRSTELIIGNNVSIKRALEIIDEIFELCLVPDSVSEKPLNKRVIHEVSE